MNALFALQVLHARCDIFSHFDQHLRYQTVTLSAQKGEKITTLKSVKTHTHAESENDDGGTKWVVKMVQ